ncbi:polysaccharide biosynthesis tyrosine autokinase [Moritella viscosa]|uniref:Chain length regulator (Capsular polysaccharide biosynthesis) n=1 Tax=Moritella viscosa TaxID=80854 RepID=A0ABY1HFR0_9GAMM|nr:polysaccharide biosynthesis tyrosine autokinase [Moritella viscosa]CED61677.1 lipopolysaccharide biosynthesis protein [Moritella viscosa]SGY90300.1 Chain length regulator (Capsular polysaccharide biosynthesis) [Moritella viscosa]SGY99345.1 Chain length regulator (Capsular polysaccharide biosynthesis) [Moritella viscosa]SHO06400.1 Chain length regulator (Capsular polysaccharide biosynthesis) [Moritella viscosa]SHO08764.1 Chain length regulator (Capsular polysaccharide biosynthesis) [Moritell
MSSITLNQADKTQQSSQTSNSSDADLGKLFGILLDARWSIIAVTFIFSVLGVCYALLTTPVYKADALIQVEQKSGSMSALVGDMGDMFSSESSATTEVEIIKSRMVLSQTVEKFNLTTLAAPKYLPVIGKGLARMSGQQNDITISRFEIPSYASPAFSLIIDASSKGAYTLYDGDERKVLSGVVGELAQNNDYRLFVQALVGKNTDEFSIAKQSKLDAIQWLQQNLLVSERGKQTGILQLTFSGEDKVLIEDILNDVSQNYFLQNVQRNSAEAEKILAFLQGHLPNIKTELTAAEDTLNRFRQNNESIDLGLEAASTLKVMVALESQLNELTFKESEISQRFTKDHPAYKSLLDKREVLLAKQHKLNAQVQKLPKTQRDVLRMKRDVEVNQQIYIQLLNKVQELSILKAGTVGNVRILDTAQAYSKAVKPKKSLIVVLVTLLGGMLAVAVVLVRAALHKGIENPDEVEALGLPVYASIPMSDWQAEMDVKFKHNKRKKNFALHETLLAESNPADLSIEALRGLRTSMHFAMMEAKNNVVMISGPAPGIGKSFVSVNFAAVIAKTGQKVLLVDGDMRKGYLQRHFNLEWDHGLSEMLSGKLDTKDVIKTSGIENLDIITRGQIPPNPSELLMHPRFADFITWASSEYDLVLIDTPPVLAVTDPSIVGALAGTTLMVGRFGQNTVKEIEVARHRFEMAGIEVKGFILNAVEKKASASYGDGYYNYSYESDKF